MASTTLDSSSYWMLACIVQSQLETSGSSQHTVTTRTATTAMAGVQTLDCALELVTKAKQRFALVGAFSVITNLLMDHRFKLYCAVCRSRSSFLSPFFPGPAPCWSQVSRRRRRSGWRPGPGLAWPQAPHFISNRLLIIFPLSYPLISRIKTRLPRAVSLLAAAGAAVVKSTGSDRKYSAVLWPGPGPRPVSSVGLQIVNTETGCR